MMYNVVVVVVVILASVCPDDWFGYKDHCYWISNDTYTYRSSVDLCWNLGAHLPAIRDNDEYTFIKNIMYV